MAFIGVQPTSAPLTSSDITDGIISTAKIADDAVTSAKIPANAVTDSELNLASNFAFTGTVSGLVGSLTYNGGTTLGNLRIQAGTATLPSSATDTGSSPTWGVGHRYYSTVAVTMSGFASTPTVYAFGNTSYHETVIANAYGVSATSATFMAHSSRSAGLVDQIIFYLAIGQAS